MECEPRKTFDLESIKATILQIKNKITKLEKDGVTDSFEKELKILELYPDFYDNYKFLVKRVCKNQDLSMVYEMMDKLEKIESGETTIEHVEQTLGQSLAEKYLYSKIKD